MNKPVLVLYIPAIHASYLRFFEKHQDVDTLYVLDQSVLDEFPILKREIRAIKPEEAVKLIKNAGYFSSVNLATAETLKELVASKTPVVTSNEYISDYVVKNYLTGTNVTQEIVFLRYDEKVVTEARKEIDFDGQISRDEFDQAVMSKLFETSKKSSDWFLRPAAVIIKNDPLEYVHNQRQPAPHSMWTDGDPRMYVEYGTDTHLRTTLHAEQVAIARAAKYGIEIGGASLYATDFPCPDCSAVIAEADIKRVYFARGFSRLSNQEILKANGIEIIQVKNSEIK